MMTLSGTLLKEVKHMALRAAMEKTMVLFTGLRFFISSHMTASSNVNTPLSWLTACDPEKNTKIKTAQVNIRHLSCLDINPPMLGSIFEYFHD
jgi:hypothetical protein